METTYSVDILGSLWMGGTAAMSREYKVGTGPFATFLPDELDRTDEAPELDAITKHVDTHEGDFAEIIACRVIRYEVTTDVHENQQGGTVSTIVTTKVVP